MKNICIADVKNEYGEIVCNIKVKSGDNFSKEYDNIDVIFGNVIRFPNIISLGEYVTKYIYDTPEKSEDGMPAFQFAFPYCKYSVLEILFTGVNMTDFAYNLLKQYISIALCDMFFEYYKSILKVDDIYIAMKKTYKDMKEELLKTSAAFIANEHSKELPVTFEKETMKIIIN